MTKKGLSALELGCGVAGMLCPIPVVGEALFARFLYPIVNEIPLFHQKNNEMNFPAIAVSVCVSALARFQLYQPVYEPMLNYFQKIF